MRDLSAVESILGYTFRDKSLLDAALTHTTFVNEHGGVSYQRLEFLGDSVLNLLVSEALYRNTVAAEGNMTKLRQQIVSKEPLREAVRALGLQQYLRTGSGKDAVSEKVISDLFESIIGAMYIDSGSLEPCKTFAFAHLKEGGHIDYKSKLQELVQSRHKPLPLYPDEEIDGGFRVTVCVDGVALGVGEGKCKKDAEQAAAKRALQTLGRQLD